MQSQKKRNIKRNENKKNKQKNKTKYIYKKVRSMSCKMQRKNNNIDLAKGRKKLHIQNNTNNTKNNTQMKNYV